MSAAPRALLFALTFVVAAITFTPAATARPDMGGPSAFWPDSLDDKRPLHAPKEAVAEAIFDNCFLAGTLVVSGHRQADGTIERVLKPIESMQPNDPVWSEDPTTGWRGWGVVKQTFTNETPEVAYLVHRPLKQRGRSESHRVGISRDAGQGGEEDGEPPSEEPASAQTIRCTPGHPWWSEDRQTFAHTATFREGERLRLEDGSLAVVVSLVVKAERARTFNFEVAQGARTYFVAEQADQPGALVHNTSVARAASRLRALRRDNIAVLKSIRRHSERLLRKDVVSNNPEIRRHVRRARHWLHRGNEGAAGSHFHSIVFRQAREAGVPVHIDRMIPTVGGLRPRRRPDFRFGAGPIPDLKASQASRHAFDQSDQFQDIVQSTGQMPFPLYYRLALD